MKKFLLISIILGLVIFYAFISSNFNNDNVTTNKILPLPNSIQINAEIGYSFVSVASTNDSKITSYIELANTPYNVSDWSWSSFYMNIDFIKNKVTHTYLIDRPEREPDVFKTEVLDMFNINHQQSIVTFDVISNKFGTLKCLVFLNKLVKTRMLIMMQDPYNNDASQVMILDDDDQIE